METFLSQEMPHDSTLKHPVFVTDAEANKFEAFENQTIQTIDHTIVALLECITDDELKSEYKDLFLNDIRKKKKEAHITFCHELEEIVSEEVDLDRDHVEENEN